MSVIERAEQRLQEEIRQNDLGADNGHLLAYWSAYLDGHGRLIDADSMEKEVCGGCEHGEHKYANCIDCALANAPTIVPADTAERSET